MTNLAIVVTSLVTNITLYTHPSGESRLRTTVISMIHEIQWPQHAFSITNNLQTNFQHFEWCEMSARTVRVPLGKVDRIKPPKPTR